MQAASKTWRLLNGSQVLLVEVLKGTQFTKKLQAPKLAA
jgi:hypothetical protein